MVLMRVIPAALVLSVTSLSWGWDKPTAAEAKAVSACAIAKDPEHLNGNMVTVHDRVSIAFENFELPASKCSEHKIDGIWLEYGRGPRRQPTTCCCGNMIPRDRLRLVENSAFREFHRALTAQRKGCHVGNCYTNTVTATITGRLDAAKLQTCPDGKVACCNDAFGHFGLYCARLVIQKVSSVTVTEKK